MFLFILGLKILTRFEDEQERQQEQNPNICAATEEKLRSGDVPQTNVENVSQPIPIPVCVKPPPTTPSCSLPATSQSPEEAPKKDNFESATSENVSVSSSDVIMNYPLKERNFVPKLRESTSFDPREPLPRNLNSDNGKENQKSAQNVNDDSTIQCNEVSSSNIELDSTCLEEEEVETSTKVEKHNLRSSKKINVDKNSGTESVVEVCILLITNF